VIVVKAKGYGGPRVYYDRHRKSATRAYHVFGLVFIVAPIAYERMLWNECRATNSFFYCVRVIA
jgi:hypothetical protein